MNQVDVKLHDLTKVKLKKYRLNWEETGNPVPRIRNWMERLDYQAVQRRELAKLLERTILFLEENQDTLFSDVIEKPFLLVSKMFWDVSKMYKVPVRGKEMVLLDGVNGFAEIYYMPVYPRYHCLSEETVFNNDYSVIQELILDKEKIKYVPPVFEVAEVEKDYLICRLDFIESILRRGAKGIKLAELKVE